VSVTTAKQPCQLSTSSVWKTARTRCKSAVRSRFPPAAPKARPYACLLEAAISEKSSLRDKKSARTLRSPPDVRHPAGCQAAPAPRCLRRGRSLGQARPPDGKAGFSSSLIFMRNFFFFFFFFFFGSAGNGKSLQPTPAAKAITGPLRRALSLGKSGDNLLNCFAPSAKLRQECCGQYRVPFYGPARHHKNFRVTDDVIVHSS